MALLGLVGAFAATTGIAACGESSKPVHPLARIDIASEQLRGPATPRVVLARVGPYSITGATFDRFLGSELHDEPASERLAPPDFSTCVVHLQSEATALGEPSPGPSQLKRECQTRYQTLLRAVLDRLISDEWLIADARELDVPVSDQAVQASLGRYRHGNTPAGGPLADIAFETKVKLASQAIRRAIKDRVRPIANAQIAAYYKSHKFEYLTAAERDLKIARTKTEASAAKVKAEIASGKSFASVVKGLRFHQALGSDEGLVLELPLHEYGEPKLNRAIFTATPGVLTGPIGTSYGYFVFDVTRIRFEHETPLGQVQAAIRLKLARPLQEHALSTFMKQWKTTWKARTDCSSGYVVPECRQFKPPL